MELSYRSTYRGQVTKIVKAATDYLQSNESRVCRENLEKLDAIEEELSTFIQRLKIAHDNLNKANCDVRSLIKAEEYAKECDLIAEYEDKAVTVMARLEQRLQRVRVAPSSSLVADGIAADASNTEGASFNRSHSVKLPKLELRRFSGDIKDWLPFWEQFKGAVHDNTSLCGADKFNYLQGLLFGKAAKTIAGFTPTDACYDGAIALLIEEYGNKEKIIDASMQKLMALQPVHMRTDVEGLRRLYNAVTTCTRSLTALGIPSNHYSIMLKSILLKCLPSNLRVDYYRLQQNKSEAEDLSPAADSVSTENSFSIDGDNQVQNIMKFLKREVESLESSLAENDDSNKRRTLSKQKMLSTAAGLMTSAAISSNCIFCNSTCHVTSDCDHSEITLQQKREILQRNACCYRCTKRGHRVKFCKVRVLCKRCGKSHASSMCDQYKKGTDVFGSTKVQTKIQSNTLSEGQHTVNLSAVSKGFTNVYLQTACVFVSSPMNNSSFYIRLILDGGSQMTFIRESVSRRLCLPIIGSQRLSIIPFGTGKKTIPRMCNRVRVLLKSQYGSQVIMVEAVEVPEICLDILIAPSVSDANFNGLTLADARALPFEPEEGISLLIGADNYWTFVTGEFQRITKQLTAINTVFGWTLQGPSPVSISSVQSNLTVVTSLQTCILEPELDVTKLWSLEVLGIKNDDMEEAEFTEHFSKSCIVKRENRYEASLPWKQEKFCLDSNYSGALHRLRTLTKRLSRYPNRLFEYDREMRNFICAGFAEKAVEDTGELQAFYLPHRPVYRDDKDTTKLRIVFDASAHAENCASLNECLLTGSNLLPDVFQILLNFRLKRIAMVADIEKAFLQIVLAEKERKYHRFIWYVDEIESAESLPELQVYRMTRLTFGVSSSPFILGATIRKHLECEAENYAETCAMLKRCFYMDDLVLSVSSEQSAKRLFKEAVEIMKKASMILRKWNCNSASVRREFLDTQPPEKQKVLGIIWHINNDEISVDLEGVESYFKHVPVGSKRAVLQMISRIFDPLGWLGPCVIKVKILFQSMWRLKLSWDEALVGDLLTTWNSCVSDLKFLKDFSIPRCIQANADVIQKQLHIFADSSLYAYGAVCYIRTTYKFGQIDVRIFCARNRVAPLKEKGLKECTLPRLELTAALLASRLYKYFKEHLTLLCDNTFLWSDSKIALSWIRGDVKRWKPYVANRVKEINENTFKTDWRHCPGSDNPADLLTRGVTGSQLSNSVIWTNGPKWLSEEEKYWPQQEKIIEVPVLLLIPSGSEEARENDHLGSEGTLLDFESFSSWNRLLRTTGYVQRFARFTCKAYRRKFFFDKDLLRENWKYLTARELREAETFWLTYVQKLCYSEEITALRKGSNISRSSSLFTLSPVIDDIGLLRVGGRLNNFESTFEENHPIILPKGSHISRIIVSDAHERTLHGGVGIVLTKIRERFWIIKARQLIKTVVKGCIVCRKLFGKSIKQPFAQLPKDRMISSRPFAVTGIDFAGPLFVKQRRDGELRKMYIMLLTCAAIRALHLELVPDLSTESCLLALRRFIARRGTPNVIYSDNAKTFKRSSLELKECGNFLNSEECTGFLSSRGITWKFIIERAPWWGGFWERLVRSVKNVLKVAIGKAVLDTEEMRTLLTEVEDILNRRPLSYISDDPLDLAPLTPAHILRGTAPTGSLVDVNLTNMYVNLTNIQIREQWTFRLKATQVFWKRWKTEYLQQLRSLHHDVMKKNFSGSLKPNDVVIVEDASSPRILWKLALVEEIFQGRDGRVRACQVRFANGSKFRRPAQLLYPLEVN